MSSTLFVDQVAYPTLRKNGDQTNETPNSMAFIIKEPPQRIVSLVPSQTETLVDLGLEEQLVGLTKFCDAPQGLKQRKTVVGGTKQVHYDKIEALKPDIILCNKEENTRAMVEQLSTIAPVHCSEIIDFEDALELIIEYGHLFDRLKEAGALVDRIELAHKDFEAFVSDRELKQVAYLIWKDPLMAVGEKTFIQTMLTLAGFKNVLDDNTGRWMRYPEVAWKDLEQADYVFLSSEPFPFSEAKHFSWVEKNSRSKPVLVDGAYFSWYGSRMLVAFAYFKQLHQQIDCA
ncbi:ABC transporter substrate-binding protein [Croceiramulus getboli]|nr:helical backbone metal receptor [Flavobacteriaceae bacterium YJPT1-3]